MRHVLCFILGTYLKLLCKENCSRDILSTDRSNRINVNSKHMKLNVILPKAEKTNCILNCTCQNTIYWNIFYFCFQSFKTKQWLWKHFFIDRVFSVICSQFWSQENQRRYCVFIIFAICLWISICLYVPFILVLLLCLMYQTRSHVYFK